MRGLDETVFEEEFDVFANDLIFLGVEAVSTLLDWRRVGEMDPMFDSRRGRRGSGGVGGEAVAVLLKKLIEESQLCFGQIRGLRD